MLVTQGPSYVVLQIILKEKLWGTGSGNLTELEKAINAQARQGYRHHRLLGAREVLVKLGADGVIVADGPGRCDHVPATKVPKAVDTTAAGDSFAGGYLAGRLAGMNAVAAARVGAELAAVVIQSPGAIISTG